MKTSLKFIYKYILVCLGMLFSANLLMAQTNVVTGKVTDADDGSGLPGVNIQVKGTTNGTVTDFDGNYSLSVDSDAVLIFSFVGYANQEVVVGNRSKIDISLSLDVTQLSEIVVVGYGEQEKADVTGVVAEVTADQFNKGAIVSPDNLISGKIAGVNVAPTSGEPGSAPDIRIRGTSSIGASNAPLYVIDGVPVDNAGFGGGRNPLNFLNPSDIESFTVLKDASAAAIYGSRGTNGVILITTKGGTFDQKPSVTYNGWYSVADAVDKVDVLTGPEFRDVVNAQASNRSDLILNANTDWQAQIFQQAIGQNHELGISGGSGTIGYRMSIGFLEQEGIIQKSKTQRATLNFAVNAKALDDNLNINLSFKGAKTDDQFQDGGAIGSAIGYAPSQPIFDANSPFGGYWEWPSSFGVAIATNPVSLIDQTINEGQAFRGLTNLKLDYDIPLVEGLTATAVMGYDLIKADNASFQPSTVRGQISNGGTILLQNTTRTNELFNFYAKYERSLESLNSTFDVMLGYEYQNRESNFPQYRGNDLSTDAFGLQSIIAADEVQPIPGYFIQRLRSYFGRLNYALKDKYLFTFTLRNDGSSQFGPENQRGWFPSAGLGWRISDEVFLQNVDAISNLKLRVGYGVLGNQDFTAFQFASFFQQGDQFTRYVLGGEPIATLRPSARNEEVKWEETTQLNIGLDYELLEGRLYGSLEYYRKNTTDLLLNTPIPAGTNLSNFVISNIGELENEGVEFELNAIAVDKNDLRWDLSYNFSTNRNEVTKLVNGNDIFVGGVSGGVGTNVQIIREGEAVNSFYTYTHIIGADGRPLVDGVDHNEDGDINEADIYVDSNGDGEVNLDDRTVTGNPFPEFQMGLSSYLRYKNFDLSFTLRGSFGQEVYNNVSSANGNYSKVQTDIVPGNMHRSVLTNEFVEPQLLSDVYLESGTFIRMDNISLGYQIPNLPSGVDLRVYGTIQNAFLLTDYEGIDPELGVNGLDNNIYPRSRTFLVGLSLGL